jgi:hypothetical protein
MRCPAFALLTLVVGLVHGTTEWFGDERSHLNPPNNAAPFYDVHYDDIGKI